MQKKTMLLLTGGTILILLSLFVLFRFSTIPNERPNGFVRYWQPGVLSTSYSVPVAAPLENIAGYTQNHVYFSVPNPQWIVSLDIAKKEMDTISYGMQMPVDDIGVRTTIVDSPHVWLFAQNVPGVYRGMLGKNQLSGTRLPYVFTRSEVISQESVVLRSVDTSLEKQTFQKVNAINGRVIAETSLFSDQKDGGFDRDGFLNYDSATNRIYYLEYYRNQFYCMDTNFNLIYTARTIDTISSQQIEIKEVKIGGEERIMPVSPRIQVNRNCFIGNDMLWVVSGLKSDNQSYGDFRSNVPIDMYRLKDGKYMGSFNLPRIGIIRPKSLAAAGDNLIALYEKEIRLFQLRLTDLKEPH
ncbi:hypothetical protein HHL16_09370 [Pseudoflavitalea sp. G-6-1-2]|uniref:hypothetical protein n=1 Tax=Pseudoflavitalea sp. G-6-1-2 TaxID=2728841 RepID=UPI00146F6D2D|nr:hypothetical protein [Pseudoflavitalea sp. G-6-1-2]NML21082.1 hypothetical protein [Pseudoflavitalea sp. G-6-1-2]